MPLKNLALRRLATVRSAFLLVGLAVAACGGEPAAEGAAPPEGGSGRPASRATAVTLTPSDLTTARMEALSDAIAISGALEPVQTIPVRAQINAIVRAVHAERGARVQRGAVLVELDAEGLRGQVEGARAAVAAAEAGVALADQRLASARRLLDAGGIPPLELQSANAAQQLAVAQLAGARAQLALASENAAQATIVAPIDGMVSDRSVEPGEAVRDGDLLLTVVDTRTLELLAQVGVDEALRVRPGATVTFTLDAAPEETFRGRVERVDPRADPATRQVGLTATLANRGGRIVAGQFAHGRVLAGNPTPLVVVPSSAVSTTSEGSSVLVVTEGRLTKRKVELGVRDDSRGLVAVRSGLVAGERLLAVPVLGAAEGLLVTLAGDATATRRDSAPGRP